MPQSIPLQSVKSAHLLGIASLLAAVLAIGTLFTSDAKATGFCVNANLAPYGQAGDKCFGPGEYKLAIVLVQTFERAGCVTYASPSNALEDSWFCIGNNATGQKYVRNDSQTHKGVIRNNNLSFWGKFSGNQTCCW
jgi:hypothetical protein